MVQQMVQDDDTSSFHSSPRYAASSLVDSRSEGIAFSLIMPGSRVRVPLQLFSKSLTSLTLATSLLSGACDSSSCQCSNVGTTTA
jgi:hypothetical protein